MSHSTKVDSSPRWFDGWPSAFIEVIRGWFTPDRLGPEEPRVDPSSSSAPWLADEHMFESIRSVLPPEKD
jgi:hypothetical protein